jgi:predicted nucleotide-binding protein
LLAIRNENDFSFVADKVADSLRSSPAQKTTLSDRAEHKAERLALAHDLAQELRSSSDGSRSQGSDKQVFLVHGHDEAFRDEVEAHIRSIGLEQSCCRSMRRVERSLFQKFERLATEARFAVVLLTADDLGASRRQYEAPGRGGERTLK